MGPTVFATINPLGNAGSFRRAETGADLRARPTAGRLRWLDIGDFSLISRRLPGASGGGIFGETLLLVTSRLMILGIPFIEETLWAKNDISRLGFSIDVYLKSSGHSM